ncbi:hypothetical protein M2101_000125 [Parabacteroides sp. PM5-20]|nr:hypothetical protein [Parabacteroides sp. PM5-20]
MENGESDTLSPFFYISGIDLIPDSPFLSCHKCLLSQKNSKKSGIIYNKMQHLTF